MHKRDQESILINTLAEGHTITAACKRAGVSRMFYDRHYKSDRAFRKQVDEARAAGKNSNDDLITTMHMKKIREAHWPAIRYGLERIAETDKEKRVTPNPAITPGDLMGLVNAMPEPFRSQNQRRLREILDDAVSVEQKGLLKDEPGRNL